MKEGISVGDVADELGVADPLLEDSPNLVADAAVLGINEILV